MIKHTEGEWYVHASFNVHARTDNETSNHRHRFICSTAVNRNDGGKTNSESKANAILIAAAPNLLEALENLTLHYTPETLDAASAAIQKARGEHL